MALVLGRFYRDGFLHGILKIFQGNRENYKKVATGLDDMLLVNADGFWSNHYRFEATDRKEWQQKESSLIGKNRARDIVVNIFFPALLLYSTESKDGALKNIVREIAIRYPNLAENTITKAMKNQLFVRRGKKAKIVKSSYQQQGMIFLHKGYCRSLKCSECLQLS